jgi:hypothetical protein
MIKSDNGNDNAFAIDSAISYKLGSREEIKLYEQIGVALNLIKDDFEIVDSCIGDTGIEFGITTKFPHKLPDDIGILFFSISHNFNVVVKETSDYVYDLKRYFKILIRERNK